MEQISLIFIVMYFLLKIRILIILIVLVAGNGLFGQSIRFSHVDMPKPVNNDIITNFFQDSKGYIWMGGWNTGLIRYDGYLLEYYKHNPNDTSSISSNSITSIIEATDGNLLVGTNNGLNKFLYKEGRFVKYFYDNDNINSISDNVISCIILDSRSRIWIGTSNGGINLFDYKKEIFKHYKRTPGDQGSLSSNNVAALVEASIDTLWVSVFEGGINKFYIEKEEFEKYFPTEWGHENYLNLNVNTLYKTNKGDLWLGTNSKGLFHFDPISHKLTNVFHKTNIENNPKYASVISLAVDEKENVWIGTYRGGLIMMDAEGEMQYFQPNQKRNTISDWLVSGLFHDKDNTLFVGQWGMNLDIQFYTTPDFLNIIPFPDKKDPIDDYANVVTAIFKDSDNDIWIGMEKEGLLQYQDEDFSSKIRYNTIWNENSIWGKHVTSICESRGKKIWIGTIGGGLNVLDKETGLFSHFMFNGEDEFSISDDNITCLLLENDSIIWIGTANGLNRYNTNLNKFYRHFHIHDDTTSLSDNYITTLYFNKGDLWVGTKGGLNKQISKNAYKSILHNQTVYNSLSDNYVTSLISDENNYLWVGTKNGLNKYDENENSFEKYNKNHGLPSNNIQSLLIDSLGYIWAGTSDDLVKIDPESRRIRRYGDEDNFQFGHIQRGSSFMDKDGIIYMGCNIGFHKFSPYTIKENDTPPDIEITSFNKILIDDLGKEVVIKDNIYRSDKMKLKHYENVIEISFSTFCYKQTQKCHYMYRMLGISDNWISNGNKNSVRFNDLKSGKYRFEVIGTNNDNFWSKESDYINIRIKPVFWNSVWFILIVLNLIIIPIIYLYLKNRPKQNEKELENEINKYVERLKVLMEEDKIYLNSELSVNDIAKDLKISEKELSGILNHHLNKNFADYINEYRVEESKNKLVDPENNNIKIIYIAYDSGFNSKAAFYSVFKKFTGMTPTEYRKKNI